MCLNKKKTLNVVTLKSLDPRFGFDEIGTYGGASIENSIRGAKFTCEFTGKADKIATAIRQANGWSGNIKCAIYKASDLSLVGVTEQRALSPTGDFEFYDFNFSEPKPDVYSDTEYWLVVWASSQTGFCYVAIETGEDNQRCIQSLVYNSFPSTLEPTGYDAFKLSIYCDYSLIGVAPTVTTEDATNIERY